MKNTQRRPKLFALFAAMAALAGVASAQTYWLGVSGVSVSTNWSDPANWSTAASPAGTDVLFGNDGAVGAAGTINSVVDASGLDPISLTFTNMSQSSLYHTILIPDGVQLNNPGTLLVGGVSAPTVTTVVNLAGGGLFMQTGAMNIKWINGTAGGSLATLDLSGLSNFVYDASSGTITIASAPSGSEARGGGVLTLAGSSNYITVGTIAMALGTGNGGTTANALNLGAGTNIINVGTVNIAAGKINTAVLRFNGATGGLRLRGTGGTDADRANFMLGRRGNTGSGAINGNVFLNDHPVDILADTITVGQSTANVSGQIVTGNLQFNAGIVDANTINLAVCSGNAGAIANGFVTVGGGTLRVGNFSLVNQTLGIAAGTLNITNGGAVICSGTFGKTTTVGIGNVTINNGSLSVSNQIGSVGAPVDNLSLSDSVLTLAAAGSAQAEVTTLTCGGATNKMNITDIPVIAGYPSQFPVIKYAGTLGGTFNIGLGTLPASAPAYAGYLSNNTVNGSIDLVVTAGPVPARIISWRGTTDGNWDITTPNWLFSASPTTFNQADFVRFDDAATRTEVTLTTTLLPSSITVSNESKAFGFTGSGTLSGETGITKDGAATLFITNNAVNDYTGGLTILKGTVQVGDGNFVGNLGPGNIANNGTLRFARADVVTVSDSITGTGDVAQNGSGTLTLSGANTYDGVTTVSQGTLQIGNNAALGTTNGGTTIASGASLDFNTHNLGLEPVTVSGSGLGGVGALVNNGAQVFPAVAFVTLTGDTAFGGVGRWDLRSSATGNPALSALTTAGDQPFKLTKVGLNSVSIVGTTVSPALGDVEVQAGILSLEAATTGLGNSASNLTVYPGASFQLYQLTNQLDKKISLGSDGFTSSLINGSGANTIVGSINMTNDCLFNVGGTSLSLNGNLTGGLLTKNGTGNLIIGGNATHAGTVVNVGTLTVNGTHAGGVTNGSITALAGSGTIGAFSDLSGALSPGGTNAAGTITLTGLALQFGASVYMELGAANTVGSGVNDLIQVNGDLIVSANTITINPQGLLQIGVPYRLFNYTGNLIWNGDLFVTGPNNYVFTVNTNTVGQINVTAAGGPPIWNGGSPTVSNWSDPANWSGLTIQPGDSLYFAGNARLNNVNDTTADTTYNDLVFTAGAGSFTLNGNSIILGGNILNNSGNSQTVNLGVSYSTSRALDGGAGTLIIGGGLTNAANATTLTLSGGGWLTNLLSSADPNSMTNILSVTSNANWTLLDNSTASPVSVPVQLDILAGTFNFGLGDSAPYLASTAAGNNSRLGVTPNAPATFNMVNGTLTIAARFNTGAAGNTVATLNQSGGTINLLSLLQSSDGSSFASTAINVTGGTLNVGVTTPQNFFLASRGTGVVTVANSGAINCATLDLSRNAAGNTLGSVGVVNLDGGTLAVNRIGAATSSSQTGGTPTATFNFNGGTLKARQNQAAFLRGSAVPPIIPIAAIVKSGGAVIDTAGFNVGIDEPLQHDSALGATADGGLTKNGAGTLTLTAASTFTGPTVVNNGTLLVSGSLVSSAVTAAAGGNVSGNGNCGSTLTVDVGGTVSPGTSIGVLTATNNITLNGVTFMEIQQSIGTNDLLRSISGSITYGGTLAVTNLGGLLSNGSSFKLFNAGSYLSSFTTLDLPGLGSGQSWNTSQLNSSGTISVVGNPAPPAITSVLPSGGNLVISGGNGITNGTYQVLTATTVNTPLSSWTVLTTGQFDGNGQFTTQVAIDLATPQRFFTIRMP